MLPLLWVLLGAGIGTGATLLVKRSADANKTVLPGQIWTLVAVARPTKPWIDISKGDVARAIRAALAGTGAHVIDAYWSGDRQLTTAVSVAAATELKVGTVLALGSEWANQATITSINQAPASAKFY